MKQYFDKIKVLETGPEKRTMALDKDAASRFIKHGLVRLLSFHSETFSPDKELIGVIPNRLVMTRLTSLVRKRKPRTRLSPNYVLPC